MAGTAGVALEPLGGGAWREEGRKELDEKRT